MNINTIKEKIGSLLDGQEVIYPVTNYKSRKQEKILNSLNNSIENDSPKTNPQKGRWHGIKSRFNRPNPVRPNKTIRSVVFKPYHKRDSTPIPNQPSIFTGPPPDITPIPKQSSMFTGPKADPTPITQQT